MLQVHPGDRVRIEFDAAAGTLTYFVNGVSQGVCFSGLTGVELFPAVAFYATSGTASILSVGVNLNGASRESAAVTAVAAADKPGLESATAVASELTRGEAICADSDFGFDTAASSPLITVLSPDKRKVRSSLTRVEEPVSGLSFYCAKD